MTTKYEVIIVGHDELAMSLSRTLAMAMNISTPVAVLIPNEDFSATREMLIDRLAKDLDISRINLEEKIEVVRREDIDLLDFALEDSRPKMPDVVEMLAALEINRPCDSYGLERRSRGKGKKDKPWENTFYAR